MPKLSETLLKVVQERTPEVEYRWIDSVPHSKDCVGETPRWLEGKPSWQCQGCGTRYSYERVYSVVRDWNRYDRVDGRSMLCGYCADLHERYGKE